MATTPLSYLNQYFTTFLNVGGGIDNSQTTGIVAQSVSGVDITKPGVACISYSNPIDTSVAEWFKYTSINGSNEFQGVTRGGEGFSAKSHSNQAVIAFPLSESHINDINAMFDSTGIDTAQISTPSSPSAGRNKLYFKSDDLPYTLTSGGTEAALATQSYVAANGGSVNLNQQAIINGNFDVWQRGTSTTLADVTIAYTADRWADYHSKGGGTLPTLTRTRQAFTPGDLNNSFFYTRLTTNGAGTSLGDNSTGQLFQKIENGTRILAGTGNTVTLSFYARSSIAGKRLGLNVQTSYGTGGSPSSLEYIKGGVEWTLTSSWVKYSTTVTLNTTVGKTFGTDYNDYLNIALIHMWGSTWGDTYVKTGVSAEDYGGSGTIDIAQVQLNAGSTALPFQPKSFAEELADCQRYFQIFAVNTGFASIILTANVIWYPIPLRTSMRGTITLDAAVEGLTNNLAVTNYANAEQTGFAFTIQYQETSQPVIQASKTGHTLTGTNPLRVGTLGLRLSSEL